MLTVCKNPACDKLFKPRRRNQLYCEPACRRRAWAIRWLRRRPRRSAGLPNNPFERIAAQSRPRPKLRTVLWEKGGTFSLTREAGARWVLKVDEVGILRRVRLNPQIKQMAGISGIYKSAKSAQSVDRRVA